MFPPLALASYDEDWVNEFRQARSSLFDAAWGRLNRIEHVGSTSVPGSSAQPVIDLVAIRSPDADPGETRLCIEGLNYRLIAETNGVLRFLKPRSRTPTHQLFVVMDPSGTEWFEAALAWRDHLRSNAVCVERFASFKQRVHDALPDDGPAYEDAKAGFARAALDVATV